MGTLYVAVLIAAQPQEGVVCVHVFGESSWNGASRLLEWKFFLRAII